MFRILTLTLMGLLLAIPGRCAEPEYYWLVTGDVEQFALIHNGRQIGNYNTVSQEYHPLTASGTWGKHCTPPANLPDGYKLAPVPDSGCKRPCCPNRPCWPDCSCCPGCPCSKKGCKCKPGDKCCDKCPCGQKPVITTSSTEVPNYGLNVDKIAEARGKHILNGKEVSREAVIAAIAKVPDDVSKDRLVIIGSEEDRKQVEADLQSDPALKGLLGSVVVSSFLSTDWQVTGVGFEAGSPRIVYETSTGLVLHSQPEYTGGPVALAEAIRKAQDGRDPSKDPDLRKSSDPLLALWEELKKKLPNLDEVPGEVWLGLALVLFLLWKKESK